PVSYFKLEYVILDFIDSFNNSQNNFFTVKNKQSIFRINLDNIIFFESKLRKINIVCSNYSEISFYDKLDNIEDALISKNFIRCHKSYLVNLNYIKKIENSKIITLNNNIIPISRSYLRKTKDLFFEYFRCKST
ncbi:TPA: LytR/AlgR family response regulator transcription factor, partial [Clostridium perfringens]